MPSSQPKLAIIGAGLAGLMCARKVQDAGLEVSVFEKSRGVGGRMATRRADNGLRFDHGAQYFTLRDPHFERYVRKWAAAGVVAEWEGRIVDLTRGEASPKKRVTPRFVGVPGMNAICKHLAADLDIRLQMQVAPPRRERAVWRLQNAQGESLGAFDCVITSAPAPQSAELLADTPDLRLQAKATMMSSCWAAMISFAQPLQRPFDGAFVHASPLSWIACNSTKPQRGSSQNAGPHGGQECWVLHASPDWSNEHIEQDAAAVLPILLAAFWQATGVKPQPTSFATAHRWRYAIPPVPLEDRCLFDPQLRIGACGDWCSGPRVEGAFLSGMSLAGRVLSAMAT